MAFPAIVGGLAGTALTAGLAGSAASKQRKWARKNYRHRYQWTMQDMKEAGLNPLLAAGMGLGGGGTASGAAAQVPDFGKIGDTANTARKVTIQDQLAKEQIKLTQANTAKAIREEHNMMRQVPLNDLIDRLDRVLITPGLDWLEGQVGTGKEVMKDAAKKRWDESHWGAEAMLKRKADRARAEREKNRRNLID